MELRGNVYDYAETAARIVHPEGWFVCCHAGTDPRLEDAMIQNGFHIWHRQDIIFRIDKEPTLSVSLPVKRLQESVKIGFYLVIRTLDSTETDRYRSIRLRKWGMSPVKVVPRQSPTCRDVRKLITIILSNITVIEATSISNGISLPI